MNTITEVLQELEQQHFFGSLEVKFEGGKVVLLRKTETIKPEPENRRNNRGDCDVRAR